MIKSLKIATLSSSIKFLPRIPKSDFKKPFKRGKCEHITSKEREKLFPYQFDIHTLTHKTREMILPLKNIFLLRARKIKKGATTAFYVCQSIRFNVSSDEKSPSRMWESTW